jgi:energy-coupling factor transporter ATP-binding protein EcfA2
MLFVLTGVSGTGKSTLLAALNDLLPASSLRQNDIDEDGVPSNADDSWRRRRVAGWYAKASVSARNGTPALLAGTVLPEDVAACASPDLPVRFCLLEADARSITERLLARFATPIAAESLKRVVGLSAPEFIATVLRHQPGFRSCFERCSFDWMSLDTSTLSVADAAGVVISWIRGGGDTASF